MIRKRLLTETVHFNNFFLTGTCQKQSRKKGDMLFVCWTYSTLWHLFILQIGFMIFFSKDISLNNVLGY